MPLTTEEKHQLAIRNQGVNEKAVARYMDLIRSGHEEEDARAIIKESFGVGDRRLDRALTTRAGQFSPSTIAELEAKALTHIGRIDLDVSRLRRFYEAQLDELDRRRADGEDWMDIEIIDQTGGKFAGTKYKKIPLAEAERQLLDALVKSNEHLLNALRALKVDTVINIKADSIHAVSVEELRRELALVQSKKVDGNKVNPEQGVVS